MFIPAPQPEPLSRFEAAPLHVVVLRTLAELGAWAEPWKALDASSSAPLCYFQSFGWCQAWLENHAGDRIDPFVVLLLRGNVLVAVLPLMRERSALGLTVLRSLGEPHTQYGNILTRDGVLTACENQLMLRALVQHSGADSIVVNYLPDGSPLQAVLGATTRVRELDNVAAQFDLQTYSSPADYLMSRSKSRRRARRKAETALAEFGEVRLEVLRPGDVGYDQAISHCVELKRNWIKHTGRIGAGLDHEGHAAFLAALPATNSADGGIVFVLRAGPVPVACEIGFLQHGHYYSYLGSFMWSLRHASAGNLQIEMTLEWLMANGVKTFDLLGNPTQYKAQWTTRRVALTGHILNLTTAGTLYSAVWVRRLRPLLKAAYFQLPTPLRTALAVVRQIDLSKLKSA